MNLTLFEDLAGELGYTVDISAANVFEAHKAAVTVHVDGVNFWGSTDLNGSKFFKFYTSGTVEEKGLQQLEDAIQIRT